MKKIRFTEEQIAFALRQTEGGAPVQDACRKMGVSELTFYQWKKKYAGVGVAKIRRLKAIKEENRKLKQLVAEMSSEPVKQHQVPSDPARGHSPHRT